MSFLEYSLIFLLWVFIFFMNSLVSVWFEIDKIDFSLIFIASTLATLIQDNTRQTIKRGDK